ncbi:MAG TPA: hypothetical protein VES88_14630 [Gemmatimonadaceae bacterium]|nr:hypothetical protein [Gemmatimonadaceae bacterium]
MREALWRQGFERAQLRGDDSNKSVQTLDRRNGAQCVALLQPCNEAAQLVQYELEPQLARLMDDDEQELVGVLRSRANALQRQQLVEREVRSVGQLVVWPFLRIAQNVATSSAAMSSTRIVSVVKNGSP